MLTEQDKEDLEEVVVSLRTYYPTIKFNLCEQDTGSTGEGIWGVPVSAEDTAIYEDEAKAGEKFTVRILNTSIYWANGVWGSKVTAINGGKKRAYAYPKDNPTLQ